MLKSTIQRIIKGELSHITRKGKVFKPLLLNEKDIKQIFRFMLEL